MSAFLSAILIFWGHILWVSYLSMMSRVLYINRITIIITVLLLIQYSAHHAEQRYPQNVAPKIENGAQKSAHFYHFCSIF